MRDLVAGIVLVAIASFAFSLYMRPDERDAPLIAAATAKPQKFVPKALPQAADEPSDSDIPEVTRSIAAAPKRVPQPAFRTQPAQVIATSLPSRTPAFRRTYANRENTPAAPFVDKVIYYKVPAQKERPPSAVVPERRVATVQKKRSLLAKTFNVVKKPYDWVKYAVTRL